MGYYHVSLDEKSQELCTTILPWGKYRYECLPMGIKNSPDIFQKIMNDILGDLDFAREYIDDILITSSVVSNKAKFVWDDTCQKAFDKIKEVISRETLLAFPDFKKEFHIYTDASNYQLGAVIMQDDKPLAFYIEN